MKKYLIVLSILLFAAAPCFSFDECISTGEISGSTVVSTSPSMVCGIIVPTDGTNSVSITIYEPYMATDTIKAQFTSDSLILPSHLVSATEIIPTTIITSSASDRAQYISLPYYGYAESGIYLEIDEYTDLGVAITGTPNMVVWYKDL